MQFYHILGMMIENWSFCHVVASKSIQCGYVATNELVKYAGIIKM
jgi:hypothetical protein